MEAAIKSQECLGMVVISRPDRVGSGVGDSVINGRHTRRAGIPEPAYLYWCWFKTEYAQAVIFAPACEVDENIDLVRPN